MTMKRKDEGEELDDEGDDEIKYVKTTQCEFPPQRVQKFPVSFQLQLHPPVAQLILVHPHSRIPLHQASQSTSRGRAPTSTTTEGQRKWQGPPSHQEEQ